MRGTVALLATAFISLGGAHLIAASDIATRTVTAHVQIAARSTLVVSSQVLRFSVEHAGQPAVATVEFVAGARTQAGTEVVLTVETVTVEGLAPGSRITFSGQGDAGLNGALVPPQPAVAARWIGSGRRTGRIAFALHTPAAGTYAVPVRFVLSAP